MKEQMTDISSILIANRGEIASRVIRTCRKMGIKSIAVFSEADRYSPFVGEADQAIYIGESSPAASYLNQDKIFAAVKKTGADAIHPGYGFLSENANFARRCQQENILFIGPNPEAIEAMGSKSKAKNLMKSNGVPVVPGYQGRDQRAETLTAAAADIGYPVLLKATAGGGGKGMRIVHDQSQIASALKSAQREAQSAFGNNELIIEKYIASGRHIEFQIFGDQHGNVIHILERECSIQRRYQKVIEESPSPVMDDDLRQKMGLAAVRAAKALQYDNAGTVEFIFDDNTGNFYFLEVNTRLQVEHPVTEAITGLDLVQMQIESAQGLPLALQQNDVQGKGYAIEARLYAEDASNDFLPATGIIQRFEAPSNIEGLRIESAIRDGSEISIFYDPMIAKIIVWDQTRTTAHRKMSYVLQHLLCLGITTNQELLLHILGNSDFKAGRYNTHFIQNKLSLKSLGEKSMQQTAFAAISVCLFRWRQRNGRRTLLRSLPSGWRNNFYAPQKETYKSEDQTVSVGYRAKKESFEFLIADQTYDARLISGNQRDIQIEIDGFRHHFDIAQKENAYFVHHAEGGTIQLDLQERFPVNESEKIAGGYESPMPSQIVKVLVSKGQSVKSGEGLIVLSSMKMESTIEAIEDGVVEEVYATEGENVQAGFLLLKIDKLNR